jgi:hypothetical protein
MLKNVVLAVLLTCIFAVASPKQSRQNSFGAVIAGDNPNIYLLATLACNDGCGFLRDEKDRVYSNLKFAPYNTPMLYEEPVLFCGDVREKFKGKQGVLVLTYRRQATLNYQGIGCHDLYNVFEVKGVLENAASH